MDVQIVGAIGEEIGQGTSVIDRDVPVSNHTLTGVDEACASATCHTARLLGLPDNIAKKITSYGVLAFGFGVPTEEVLSFSNQLQLDALHILKLISSEWVTLAKQVNSSLQLEAISIVTKLGIDVSNALKVHSHEDIVVLHSLKPGSIPAAAINAGAPIDRATEFQKTSQLAALKSNLTITVSLVATDLKMLAWRVGMSRDCAWNVTNAHQIDAYKTIQQGGHKTNDVCRDSLAFKNADQLSVLKSTGDVALSLLFHNLYARKALNAGMSPNTSSLIDNPHSFVAAKGHKVPDHLVASFTSPEQLVALERNLMSHQQAADSTWLQIRLKMEFLENYFDACNYAGIPHFHKVLNVVPIILAIALVAHFKFGILVFSWPFIALKRVRSVFKSPIHVLKSMCRMSRAAMSYMVSLISEKNVEPAAPSQNSNPPVTTAVPSPLSGMSVLNPLPSTDSGLNWFNEPDCTLRQSPTPSSPSSPGITSPSSSTPSSPRGTAKLGRTFPVPVSEALLGASTAGLPTPTGQGQ